MRLRRSGRRFGPLILRARLRGIARRQLVVRPLRPRTCLSRCRVFLLGQRGSERGGKKLFAGNQRGNEERPGQETEGAGSLISTLHSSFENLPLLFEQFTLFYLVHDRRLSGSETALARKHSPPSGSLRHVRRPCRATYRSPCRNALRRSDPLDPSNRWRILAHRRKTSKRARRVCHPNDRHRAS